VGLSFTGPVTRVVPVEETTQVGQVRREALALAAQAGFDALDAGRVGLAATELATNVLRHGRGGRVLLSLVQGSAGVGVELCAVDRGPGFSLAHCLPDGYSTAGSQGQGLGAIQRQCTVLDAWSDAAGAVVLARIFAAGAGNGDLAYGAMRIPMRHEVVCGDGWTIRWDDTRCVVALIDGLGHGPQAGEAAMLGLSAVEDAEGPGADAYLARMHARMSRTRGGAAAVCCIESDSRQAAFAGAGNVGATLVTGAAARQLPSHPGIVGANYRPAPPVRFEARPGSLLLMHSDGLQSRWDLARYDGLVHRHPALVVAVLHRDFDRGRDDTGIVALRLEAGND